MSNEEYPSQYEMKSKKKKCEMKRIYENENSISEIINQIKHFSLYSISISQHARMRDMLYSAKCGINASLLNNSAPNW